MTFAGVVALLRKHGLLLVQDKTLPSIVGAITGESAAGSWWGHPRGQEIFAILERLSDHPDVVFTKLIAGKVTLVHRSFWPALLGVATSGEEWQTGGLSPDPTAKELEKRLLAYASQVHTESGKHETVLTKWEDSPLAGVKPLPPEEARRTLEEAAIRLGAKKSSLPWHAKRKR